MDLQLLLTILLIFIELIAFAWLIIDMRKSKKKQDKIIVDTLKWNGKAKKSGFEMGDHISEFKIENSNRPNKNMIYPIAIFLLFIFGYLNYKRKI